jgi:hypothetical protein
LVADDDVGGVFGDYFRVEFFYVTHVAFAVVDFDTLSAGENSL